MEAVFDSIEAVYVAIDSARADPESEDVFANEHDNLRVAIITLETAAAMLTERLLNQTRCPGTYWRTCDASARKRGRAPSCGAQVRFKRAALGPPPLPEGGQYVLCDSCSQLLARDEKSTPSLRDLFSE